jgi:hypothetical protein
LLHLWQDHPKDAEYLNRPIEFYHQMQTAFGNTCATGKYAMGSGEALGVFSGFGESDGVKQECGEGVVNQVGKGVDQGVKQECGEGSKGADPTLSGAKRKRTSCFSEVETVLMTSMADAVNNVAAALRESGPAHVDDCLYEAVMSAPGFTEEALMVALSHLLDNRAQGRGYIQMNEAHRVLWLRTWLGKHYY